MPPKKPDPEPGALPDLERTTVTLPWDSFRSLLEVPAQADTEPAPPAPCLVKRASYEGKVVGRHADLSATFEVEVFTSKWVNAPLLPAGNLALRSAQLLKKPVVLAVVDGYYCLPLKGAGTYRVTLDFAVELSDPDSQSGLSLSLAPVPVSELTLTVPGTDLELSVEPAHGVVVEKVRKESRVTATLGPATDVNVDWRKKEGKPEVRLLPLVSADTLTSVSLADRVMTLTSRVALSIQRAPIPSLVVQLPEGVNLLSAEGETVRDWELEGKDGEPGGRRARLHFHYDLQGEHVLTLRAERAVPEAGQVQVPALLLAWDRTAAQAVVDGKPAPEKALPELVERQKGLLALAAEPRTEVKVGRTQNLSALDVKELPAHRPPLPHPPLHALRYSRVPWSLGLEVQHHEDVAVLVAAIDHAHLEVLALEEGRLLGKVYLDVRNNARQYLQVKLPPGALLWSAMRGDHPVKPAADASGAVRIPLTKGGEGVPFTVELAYFQELPGFGPGGARVVELPHFDLPVSYYSVQLYLPRRYRHYNFEGGLKRVEALSRAFTYRGAAVATPTSAMSQMSNVFTPPPPMLVPGGRGEDTSGQLPIRIPMLRRGLEGRFERTLVVDEPVAIRWECKRRRTDV